MKGLGLTVLFGVIGGVISHGLFISNDLRAFDLVAAAGAMAGYPLGDLTAASVNNAFYRAVLIVISFALCAGSIIWYIILVQAGSANVSTIIFLGVLIAVIFASLFFLMPLAGIVVKERMA